MNNNQRRDEERDALLERVVERMELPMVVLGFAWLILLIVDFVWGLHPVLQWISTIIWIIFILDFLLELIIAPKKIAYLRRNWLMVLALFVPALRVFRFLQVVRIIPGARLVRVLSSMTRAMHALGASLGRHGFRYVVGLSLLVMFAGAAGMYAFERPGLRSYPDALWWTAMIITTLGSGYWPRTLEGRVLCIILSLYAFSVFGYVTATLATFLVGREAEKDEGELAGAKSIAALHNEVIRLREEIETLSESIQKDES